MSAGRHPEPVGPGPQRGPGQHLPQQAAPVRPAAELARPGRDAVPPHRRVASGRRADEQPEPAMPRSSRRQPPGPLGHPLGEGRAGQRGEQVGGHLAHPGVPVVERGVEQGLVGQAQPVRDRVEEHDALGRAGRVPARRDQVPGGAGIPGAKRGQVTAALGGVAQPPRVVAGRGVGQDELPLRVEPGQPACPRAARRRDQAAEPGVGRRDPPGPVQQRGQQPGGHPAAAVPGRRQPLGQQVSVLPGEHPGQPPPGRPAHRGSRVRLGRGRRLRPLRAPAAPAGGREQRGVVQHVRCRSPEGPREGATAPCR